MVSDMSYSMKKSVAAIVLMAVLALAMPSIASAKSTSNPNHKGWTGKYPQLNTVEWKPIKAKCDKCTELVEQYNSVVSDLLNSRHWVQYHRERIAHKQSVRSPADEAKQEESVKESESKAIAEALDQIEESSRLIQKAKKRVYMLEQQASYLRQVIIQCELTACEKPKKVKIKEVEIGGDVPSAPWQPDIAGILKTYKIDWRKPYISHCKPCLPIVKQLNAVPGWVTRAHLKLQVEESVWKGLYDKRYIETLRAEIRALAALYKKLKAQLRECEQKYCPISDNKPISVCPEPIASAVINVGPNAEVGSSANFKEKAKKKAAGLATKAITGLLGIGGSGGKSSGPGTYKDPVKNKYKIKVKSKKPRREIRVGAVFTPEGLLVSTNIKKAPGKGTFQTVYIENQRGWRLYPIALFMYEIWQDWKLSVSWTRDTYVDGNLVKHEQGGWTESWRELIAKGEELIYALVQDTPIWEQLGFNTAVSGVRSLGTLFPVSPQMLANEPINLVVHVTTPKTNPVMTVPTIFQLSLDQRGRVQVDHVEQTLASSKGPCAEKVTEKSADKNVTQSSNHPNSDLSKERLLAGAHSNTKKVVNGVARAVHLKSKIS